MLADLHSVDLDDVALDGFGRPDGFLERQVRLWWRQWTEVKSEDLADASRLHDLLVSSLPTTPGQIGIVHGDYRIDNTLLAVDDITKVLAVVDWELATIGDVQTDVALMCVYRQPELDAILGVEAAWASDRLPSGDALAREVRRAARGRPAALAVLPGPGELQAGRHRPGDQLPGQAGCGRRLERGRRRARGAGADGGGCPGARTFLNRLHPVHVTRGAGSGERRTA